MKSFFKPLLLAGLLATAGFTASAQPMNGGDCPMMGPDSTMQQGMRHDRMGKMDPAKMQERMAQRQADLKAKLKITTAQEDAWTTYLVAMRPPVDLMTQQRPDRAALDKLTTPERIDQMKALRTQHMNEMHAVMDKRGEATKAFYAVLTPEQQKVFDTSAMQGRKGGYHYKGHGPAMQPKS